MSEPRKLDNQKASQKRKIRKDKRKDKRNKRKDNGEIIFLYVHNNISLIHAMIQKSYKEANLT